MQNPIANLSSQELPRVRFREVIGIDGLSDPPVAVRTVRVRGKLRHTRIETESLRTCRAAMIAGCLGNRESVVRRIEAPFASLAKAGRVFPALLDLKLPFPETECERLFLEPQSEGGVTRTLAVAARRGVIAARLEAYRALGCDPFALDQEALALWTQSILEHPTAAGAKPDTPRLVIALRDHGATLCLGDARGFRMAGNLPEAGAAEIHRRIKALDNIPEVPVEIHWTGPGIADAGRLESLIADLDARMSARHRRHKEPESMLARALATRAMTPGPLRCNLLIGEFLHPAIGRRLRNRSLIAAAAVGLTGLGLMAIAQHWHSRTEARTARLRRETVARAEELVAPGSGLRGRDIVAAAERQVGDMVAQSAIFAELTPPTAAIILNTIIAKARLMEIQIHALSLKPETIEMQGSATTWEEAANYLHLIENALDISLNIQRQWDAETDVRRAVFEITGNIKQ